MLMMLCLCVYGCCAPEQRMCCTPPLPPAPQYPADHLYTLDELVQLSVYRNAGLDAARYEAEALQGLVDQVKSLWLPSLRYDLAATAYDNDLSYRARAYNLATINVPITGAYNITNNLALAQIVATGGKRTSGLKQVKMLAALARLDVLRQQDLVAFEVATLYHLVCLTNDMDDVLEDTLRRMRVYRQVANNITARGSLRSNKLSNMEADLAITELEQLQITVQGSRQKAYAALKQVVGLDTNEPMLLASASLPPAITPEELVSAAKSVAAGFVQRPETREVDLFAKIFAEQVRFAKAAWAPNIAFVLNGIYVSGNHNTILGALQGLIAGVVVDLPLYQPARRGQLREALNLEQASLATQHEVEQLITLDIQAAAICAQEALALWLHSSHALQVADEHFESARDAYSRELITAPTLVVALAVDAVAKIGQLSATFNYHNARANLRRALAERDTPYGY
jgi:outer membrane protein TolC